MNCTECRSEGTQACIACLRGQLAAMIRERDAYKRAKGENDDRFMVERDEARDRLRVTEQLLIEAAGEIVMSKEARKAIGKKTMEVFRRHLMQEGMAT